MILGWVGQKWTCGRFRKQKWSRHHYSLKVIIGKRWQKTETCQQVPVGPHSSPLCVQLSCLSAFSSTMAPPRLRADPVLWAHRGIVMKSQRFSQDFHPSSLRTLLLQLDMSSSRFSCKPELISNFSLIFQLPFPDLYFPGSSPNHLRSISYNEFLIP